MAGGVARAWVIIMRSPPRKPRKRPSSSKRSFGARSVAYEFWMLWILATFKVPEDALPPEFTRGAMLESLLLHFRGLREFFKSKSSDADTVLAADFAPRVPPAWKNIVEREGPRLNKLLSHVSYSRRDLLRNWDHPKIARIVRERFVAFLGAIPDPERTFFATAEMKQLLPEVAWSAATAPSLDA